MPRGRKRTEARIGKIPQATSTVRQRTTLEEAQDICTSARNVSYGEPIDNHTTTANLYNAYLGGRALAGYGFLGPEEVCILNILQKISRTCFGGYSRDTIVDIEGYAFNIEKIIVARNTREQLGAQD